MTPTQKPNDHLALAIITTLFCCLPLGIVSIIRSTQVNSYWAAEKDEEAEQASADAKKWAIIGMVVMAIGVLLYVLFVGAIAALGIGLSNMDL